MASPTGYPDWQRQVSWDGPVLLDLTTQTAPVSYQSAIMDVSRFAYVVGTLQVQTWIQSITFAWYADNTFTKGLGSRTFTMDPNITFPAQFRIPNLGPYVLLQVARLPGGQVSFTTRLLGSNRYNPNEFIPFIATLIHTNSTIINNATTQTLYPTGYFSGAARVSIFTAGGLLQWSSNYTDSVGAGQPVDVQVMTSTVFSTTTVLPPDGWNIQVTNNTGAAVTYWLHITASTSGST